MHVDAACPSFAKGTYAYDFGDTGNMTPLIKSHTLGHPFVPPPDHAGGLRYHAMAPLISHLKELGELEAVAYGQTECFEAGVLFAKAEGILPAPEVCVYLSIRTGNHSKTASRGSVDHGCAKVLVRGCWYRRIFTVRALCTTF